MKKLTELDKRTQLRNIWNVWDLIDKFCFGINWEVVICWGLIWGFLWKNIFFHGRSHCDLIEGYEKRIVDFLLIIWPSMFGGVAEARDALNWMAVILFATNFYPASWLHAWRNADASKSGVAQETLQNTIRRGSKVMTEQEAQQILGVTEKTSWDEILKVGVFLLVHSSAYNWNWSWNMFLLLVQKYDTLFERNSKNGSFYIQSKVHRAKECLEAVHQGKGEGTPTWESGRDRPLHTLPLV